MGIAETSAQSVTKQVAAVPTISISSLGLAFLINSNTTVVHASKNHKPLEKSGTNHQYTGPAIR